MTTSRTFNYLILLAATLFALVIHSYYVEYYVSAHESAFLSLKPLPPFAEDRKVWIEARKKEAIEQSFEYSFTEHKRVVNSSKLRADFERIYSTPLFLAVRPSRNITFQSIGRAKERAFWLGCVVPLLIAMFPALLLVRSLTDRRQAMPPSPESRQDALPERQTVKSHNIQRAGENPQPSWSDDSFTRDNPALITEEKDYVSHEYALAREFFESRSLEYRLVNQKLIRANGRMIDALEFSARHGASLEELTYILHFDITRGFNALGK